MSLTPFSLFVAAVPLLLLLKNRNGSAERFLRDNFIFALCVTLFTGAGWFLRVGGAEIGYSFAVSSYLFLLCVLHISAKGPYDAKLLQLGALFLLFAAVGLFHAALSPYRGGIIQKLSDWDRYILGEIPLTRAPAVFFDVSLFAALLRFPVILAAVRPLFRKRADRIRALDAVLRVSDLMIVYGFFEAGAKFFLKLDLTAGFLDPFFGKTAFTSYDTARLQGFYKEASHYSHACFLLCLLQMFRIRLSGDGKGGVGAHARLLCFLLLMILSTSFTAALYCVAVAMLYPAVCRGVNVRYILGGSAGLAVLALLVVTDRGLMAFLGLGTLNGRIERAFQSIAALCSGGSVPPTSEGARFTSIFYMFRILMRRPLFGMGMGLTDAHSTVCAVLGNFGLVGFSLWCAMLFRFGGLRKNFFFPAVLLVCMAFSGGIGYFTQLYYPFLFVYAGGVSSYERAKLRLMKKCKAVI